MKADIQSLMGLCRANEEAEGFDLGGWIHDPKDWWDGDVTKDVGEMLADGELKNPPCGTHGCLVGNHLLATREFKLLNRIDTTQSFETVAKRYGLTVGEAEFLFAAANHRMGRFGLIKDFDGGYKVGGTIELCREYNDRESAIRRVRKLIYYKLRKRELCYEEDGRVKESARRAEGDHRIDRQVLAAC